MASSNLASAASKAYNKALQAYNEAENRADAADSENRKAKKTLDQCKEKETEASKASATATSNYNSAKANTTAATNAANTATTKANNTKNTLSEARSKVEKSQKTLDDYTLAQATENSAQIALDQAKAEKAELNQTLTDLNDQKRELNSELSAQQASLVTAKNDVLNMQTALNTVLARKEAGLFASEEEANEAVALAQENLNLATSAKNQIDAEISSLNTQISNVNSSITSTQTAITNKNNDIATKQSFLIAAKADTATKKTAAAAVNIAADEAALESAQIAYDKAEANRVEKNRLKKQAEDREKILKEEKEAAAEALTIATNARKLAEQRHNAAKAALTEADRKAAEKQVAMKNAKAAYDRAIATDQANYEAAQRAAQAQAERFKAAEKAAAAAATNMDDNGYSGGIVGANYTNAEYIVNNGKDIFDFIKRSHGIYQRKDIDIFNKRYRFGLFNPYDIVSTTREFLFFTKPDLNIFARDPVSGTLSGGLNPNLAQIPYWKEFAAKYVEVARSLQLSLSGKKDPFNHLLGNMCISNLSVPSLDAETIETPNNMYGVGFSYRGSSEASNDSFDFDLEFKDTRYLPIYQFFKAYEEYETLKHHGTVGPWKGYIQDKVLHDQFAIYKFLVAEDMETIIYYCKFYGVIPKSLPRDVFSSAQFDSGLSYSISFRSAFFDDMDPLILNDFNMISKTYYDSLPYRIDVYNDIIGRIDNRAAKAAYIVSASDSNAPGGKVYKLKWKGSDTH